MVPSKDCRVIFHAITSVKVVILDIGTDRTDRHYFAGSGSVSVSTIHYPCQPNAMKYFTFSRNFQYNVQNTKRFDTYDTDKI
jgi:hypothetical protein